MEPRIDPRTHQKSMPKLVPKMMMGIMKYAKNEGQNHANLLEIQLNLKVSQAEYEHEIHHKYIQNKNQHSFRNQYTNKTIILLEEVMQKT